MVHEIVLRFADGRVQRRMWLRSFALDAVGSVLTMDIDGRHYTYYGVASFKVVR